ncbi:MAG: hypothetical protein U0Q21_04190 [Dermatophilaceae bacterium]
MTWPQARACLGDRVGDYVGGVLADDEQIMWDRHLVACLTCRGSADLERRLRATLRSAPAVPPDLRALLLSVSQEIPVAVPATRPVVGLARGPVPSLSAVRPAPGPSRPAPDLGLVVLAQGAPAQHRSALRAALFATAAAGASAAAVWGMSVAPGTTTARFTPTTLPSRPVNERPAGFTSVGSTVLVNEVVGTRRSNGAQSTP